MTGYCRYTGVACEFATEYGYCKITGCVKRFGNSEQLGKDHVADPGNMVGDTISRRAALDAVNSLINRFEGILSDIRESKIDDSVCGMCEYDGAFVGQSGDWCNECPGFEKDDCFKLSDECRKRWLKEAIDGVEK